MKIVSLLRDQALDGSNARFRFGGIAIGGVLLILLPMFGIPRLLDIAIISLLFAVMAAGLYLVVGLCKLFDLGYAGFVCLGAYATGILLTKLQWGYLPAAASSVLVAMFAGIVLGLPTLPLRGDYFAIVTFGFAELVILLMRNWTGLTGGPYGLGGIPDPIFFGLRLQRYPPVSYYFLLLGMTICIFAAVWFLRRTMLGSQMIAVGDDEKLCAVTGIDIVSVKIAAFALSAGIGGLVGSFWAIYFKFISYLDFTLNLSVQVIAIVILAGDRRLRSLLLATAVIAPTSEILRTWLRSVALPEASRIAFFGVILILLTMWRARPHAADRKSIFVIFQAWIQKLTPQLSLNGFHAKSSAVLPGSFANIPEASAFAEVGEIGSTRHLNGPILTINKLHVSFGGATALDGIEVTLAHGEALAVVGPNGSGKTSLLNALSGLVQCNGIVELVGRDVIRLPSWIRARLGLRRTFQHARQFEGLGWGANIRLASFTNTQRPVGSLLKRIAATVKAGFVPLTFVRERSPARGRENSARLQLERVFDRDASVILLDEPLAGKPATWVSDVLDHIRTHKRRGGSVIVVEHNVQAILPVIDRVLMLDKGRVKFLGSVEDYICLQPSPGDWKWQESKG